MTDALSQLSGGDLRSEGRAAEVAAAVIGDPALLTSLAQGLHSEDRLVRARTCMAIEVISRDDPALLTPIVPQLLDMAPRERLPQARWHLAEIFGRIRLGDEQVESVVASLLTYLEDRSKIVRCCAVDTLGALAGRTVRRDEIIETISGMTGVTKSLDRAVARAMRALGGRDDE
jgi:hypothetical protein